MGSNGRSTVAVSKDELQQPKLAVLFLIIFILAQLTIFILNSFWFGCLQTSGKNDANGK